MDFDGTGLIAEDPWLEPYRQRLRERYSHYLAMRSSLPGGDLAGSTQVRGHHFFGLNRGVCEGKTGRLVLENGLQVSERSSFCRRFQQLEP